MARLEAYALICQQRQDQACYEKYHQIALSYATQWIKLAQDQDHYLLVR